MGRVKEWYQEHLEREMEEREQYNLPFDLEQFEYEMAILPMDHNRRPLTTDEINLMAKIAAEMDKADKNS